MKNNTNNTPAVVRSQVSNVKKAEGLTMAVEVQGNTDLLTLLADASRLNVAVSLHVEQTIQVSVHGNGNALNVGSENAVIISRAVQDQPEYCQASGPVSEGELVYQPDSFGL